jgi:hypothetical protein
VLVEATKGGKEGITVLPTAINSQAKPTPQTTQTEQPTTKKE